MREGAVWSWQSFEDQSSERRGPETEQAVKMPICSERSWNLCVTGEEKSDVRMEPKITGILRAGCFLLHGLLKEYNIKSDCPIHEWIRLRKVGVHDGFKLFIKSIFRVSEYTGVYMCCTYDNGHAVLLSTELLCEQNLHVVVKY